MRTGQRGGSRSSRNKHLPLQQKQTPDGESRPHVTFAINAFTQHNMSLRLLRVEAAYITNAGFKTSRTVGDEELTSLYQVRPEDCHRTRQHLKEDFLLLQGVGHCPLTRQVASPRQCTIPVKPASRSPCLHVVWHPEEDFPAGSIKKSVSASDTAERRRLKAAYFCQHLQRLPPPAGSLRRKNHPFQVTIPRCRIRSCVVDVQRRSRC